jgi:hypothetical protein
VAVAGKNSFASNGLPITEFEEKHGLGCETQNLDRLDGPWVIWATRADGWVNYVSTHGRDCGDIVPRP